MYAIKHSTVNASHTFYGIPDGKYSKRAYGFLDTVERFLVGHCGCRVATGHVAVQLTHKARAEVATAACDAPSRA